MTEEEELILLEKELISLENKINYKEDFLLTIPIDDEIVYKDVYQTGELDCIFQFENNGIREYCKKLKPIKFRELAVLNSLYRPAGIISGAIDEYVKNTYLFREIEQIENEIKILEKEIENEKNM